LTVDDVPFGGQRDGKRRNQHGQDGAGPPGHAAGRNGVRRECEDRCDGQRRQQHPRKVRSAEEGIRAAKVRRQQAVRGCREKQHEPDPRDGDAGRERRGPCHPSREGTEGKTGRGKRHNGHDEVEAHGAKHGGREPVLGRRGPEGYQDIQ
jgi:hypothetical protein